MKELLQVRGAVIAALGGGGVTALAAFRPGERKRYPGAVAAVDVAEVTGRVLGFCNYLGELLDPVSGTVREVYGKELDAVISVDVRAEGAGDCENGCAAASEVLLSGLPVGIRAGELAWEAVVWEKETGMFLRRGRLRCRAIFTAQTAEEGEAFLRFTLKGVVI
ncbi:MAG: hypothetical protein RRY97_06550 [Oscillibacter sp.]